MSNANCHPERQHYAKGLCSRCYSHQWLAGKPHKRKEAIDRATKYYWANRDKVIARHKRKYKESGGVREYTFKLKEFGLTYAEYMAMVDAQGGKCKICNLPDKKRLAVDHCHATGVVRGLLCMSCNTKLGWYESRLDAITDYLKELKK